MTGPRPVVVLCERGSSTVLAKPVVLVGDQPALVEGSQYQEIGAVRAGVQIVDGKNRGVWRAYDMAGTRCGAEASKPAALQALLNHLGLRQIEMNDTIPDLLAGL